MVPPFSCCAAEGRLAKEPEPGSVVHKSNHGNEMAKSGQKSRRLKKFTLRPTPDLAG